MAVSHAQSGEVVSVRPLGSGLAGAKTITLIKTKNLEVIRLVLPRGKHLPRHEAPAEVTIQCLEGRIRMDLSGRIVELSTGDLLYLDEKAPHDVQAVEDSTVLATLLLPHERRLAWPSVLAEELNELS
jgi:quercetin dioxygenase-like cupin family protein